MIARVILWIKWALPPLEKFFLTMVHLWLGFMEQDLAYQFGISQPTVSQIIYTWINFLYLKLKKIPMWPPRGLIQADMPQPFKDNYPTTRVILDATEIYIEQPKLPELQHWHSQITNSTIHLRVLWVSCLENGYISYPSTHQKTTPKCKQVWFANWSWHWWKTIATVWGDKIDTLRPIFG